MIFHNFVIVTHKSEENFNNKHCDDSDLRSNAGGLSPATTPKLSKVLQEIQFYYLFDIDVLFLENLIAHLPS